MKRIKKIVNLLRKCWRQLLIFELLYKLLSAAIFTPIVVFVFNLSIKISVGGYLTVENLAAYVTNPLTLLLLLVVLGCMSFYSLFDISAIIFIYDAAHENRDIRFRDIIKNSFRHSLKVFDRKNILFSVYILFMIPFLNLGIASGYISSIAIPNVVMDFIRQYQILFVLLITGIIVLGCLVIRWIYSLHYFVLEDCTFRQAAGRSVQIMKQNFLRDGFVLILMELVVAAVFYLINWAGIAVITLICKHFLSPVDVISVLMLGIVMFVSVFSFLSSALASPIFYGCISVLFYQYEENQQQTKQSGMETCKRVRQDTVPQEKASWRKRHANQIQVVMIVLLLAVSALYVYLGNTGKVNFNIEYIHTMEVSAHRGDSYHYPENTMCAFEGALEAGADWIELDVQQTADGQIVVMHDSNLKRTTGVDRNIWEVTYDEIKDLDCGSWFDAAYADERIPLLEEVVDFAKENGIRLNIELKPTGHETEFEKTVVDIIMEYEYAYNCVVTSQSYESLAHVKQYDETIKTVYVMSVAYGGITNLEYADAFSVESSFVTETLVDKVHNEGKELYVWTVNSSQQIKKMMELNVDNIITDHVSRAHELIYSAKSSNVILKYVKYLLSL